jgi:hypothetical protein
MIFFFNTFKGSFIRLLEWFNSVFPSSKSIKPIIFYRRLVSK